MIHSALLVRYEESSWSNETKSDSRWWSDKLTSKRIDTPKLLRRSQNKWSKISPNTTSQTTTRFIHSNKHAGIQTFTQCYPLEVQPPCFIGWFPSFTNNYCSRSLSSSKRNYQFFHGGWLPRFFEMAISCSFTMSPKRPVWGPQVVLETKLVDGNQKFRQSLTSWGLRIVIFPPFSSKGFIILIHPRWWIWSPAFLKHQQ